MKKLITFKQAGRLSLLLFGLFSVFHLVIILGIVLFDFAPVEFLWGGQMETKEQLLVFEIISLIVMIFCLFVVMIRTERLKFPKLMKISNVALWILSVLFLLNTVGNIFAKTTFEKCFAIITAILTVLCVRMALEKINFKK